MNEFARCDPSGYFSVPTFARLKFKSRINIISTKIACELGLKFKKEIRNLCYEINLFSQL